MINNNLIALIITFAIAIAWLRLNDFLAHRGITSSQLSRKIIHAGTGPLFVMCWILFKHNESAPFIAALVPMAITVQFALVGFGIIKDEAAVAAMSRTGDRREILRGPLFYGIVFILITILFWTKNPSGMIALMMLCGGDGLADIFGKKFRSPILPWSRSKSVAGSLAMYIGGWLFSVGIIAFYILFGVFAGPFIQYLLPITVIALAATLVESLPLKDSDNLTVPAISLVIGYIFF
jgi:phytol kinase